MLKTYAGHNIKTTRPKLAYTKAMDVDVLQVYVFLFLFRFDVVVLDEICEGQVLWPLVVKKHRLVVHLLGISYQGS